MSLFSWPIARATIRERLNPAAGICALMLVLMGLFRGGAAPGAEAFTGGSTFWLAMFVLVLSGGVISGEVESGHAQLVLLKPITRGQWVSGRLLGVSLILAAGTVLAWAGSLVVALLRGEGLFLVTRLLVLPLALLPAVAWLATALALSTVLRGWLNVAVLVGVKAGWFFASQALPQLIHSVNLVPIAAAIDPYVGPQDDLSPLLVEKAWQSVALWDLFWLFAAWTLAVFLFNRRELARRRA